MDISKAHLQSNKMTMKTILTLTFLVLTLTDVKGQSNSPSKPTTPPNQPTNPPSVSPAGKTNAASVSPSATQPAPTPGQAFGPPSTTPPAPQAAGPPSPTPPLAPSTAPAPSFRTPGPPTEQPFFSNPVPAASGGSPSVSNNVDSCGCGPPVTIYQSCGNTPCAGQNNIIYRDISESPTTSNLRSENQVLGCDCEGLKKRIKDLEDKMQVTQSQTQELIVQTRGQVFVNDANKDCYDLYYRNNVKLDNTYGIKPDGRTEFSVQCKFDTSPDGVVTDKWTVIMNRHDGRTTFDRSWAEYRDGFGTIGLDTNFWLGLEKMHMITSQRQYTALIEFTDWNGVPWYAEYTWFLIRSEEDKYSLYYGGYSGNAGDSLGKYHLNMSFSTRDNDNDMTEKNCAEDHRGGFWYRDCDHANFNGPIVLPKEVLGEDNVDRGMEWDTFDLNYSFKQVRILIKPTFEDNNAKV